MVYRNRLFNLFCTLILIFSFSLTTIDTTQAADSSRATELWTQSNRDFEGWKLDGVSLNNGSLALDAATARSGTDSANCGNNCYYNGQSFYYGEALSPYYSPAEGFDSAIASWNAETPTNTWVEVKLRVLVKNHWSKYYSLGVWANDTSTVKRHSVNGQNDADAKIETDTLLATSRAASFQLKVTLFSTSPNQNISKLNRISVNTVRNGTYPPYAPLKSAWGKELAVPERSQMIYPDGGEVWCSPTSLSMVMAFLGQKWNMPQLVKTVPEVAAGTYDKVYNGNGNWPFNVAFAAGNGLRGYVSRFNSLRQVEDWINAGLPVIASIAFSAGQLPGAPLSATDGHLLVIRGFDSNGNVITNDPAGDPRKGQSVRTVYNRAAFERAWLGQPGGTVYLLYPPQFTGLSDDPQRAYLFDSSTPRYAYPEIGSLWASNDAATANGTSGRGWIWGPNPNTGALLENYAQGPNGSRVVQYFDKSRMEISNPAGDRESKWFVTNGLLTQELVSGKMQAGDYLFETRQPSNIPVAGDPDSTQTPTYASFTSLASIPGFEAQRRAPKRVGQTVTDLLTRNGNTIAQGVQSSVKIASYDDQLGHNIPDVLWSWMNSPARSGMNDWLFVLGYPTSEPYWVDTVISGKPTRVLVQLYERRTLTYNPNNAAAWQVEMGNIGQHYYHWRYGK